MSTKRNSISPRRAKIIEVLDKAGDEMQIQDIVEETDLDYNNARSALSEMTSMGLIVRVHRGVYDLPERVEKKEIESPDHPLQKILQNQQILKVLLNTVITNKALMEALLLGQQEIIQALRSLSTNNEEDEEAIKNLEEVFAKRIEWHFDVAAEQVTAQYTKLPEEVFDVLVAPLTRDKGSKNKIWDPLKSEDFKRSKRRNKKTDKSTD